MIRNRVILSFAFVLGMTLAAAAQDAASPPKLVDPSGTWQWDVEFNGAKIGHTLILNWKDDKLSGTYKTVFADAPADLPPEFTAPLDIEAGKLQGDKVSFSVTRNFGGNKLTIAYSGVASPNEIKGVAELDFGQGLREFEWTPKRVVLAEDVVGEWTIKITMPQGEVEETMSLEKEAAGGKLQGTFHSRLFGDYPLKDVEIKDANLLFTVEMKSDNGLIVAKYTAQPRGDKIGGTIAVNFGGQDLDMKFAGSRTAAKSNEAQ